VTPADRRLAALVAAFAPTRAPSLLARLGSSSAADVVQQVERLVASPRRERLAALAGALAAERPASSRGPLVARAERPATAAICKALGEGTACGAAAPALIRLCRQRVVG